MTVQPAVIQETKRIAGGTLILTAAMLIVFVLLGRMDYTVVLGALLGAAYAVGNFFLLALSVQMAAEKMNGSHPAPLPEPEEGEEPTEAPLSPEAQEARKKMQLSYTGRMLLLIVVAIVAIKAPCFNAIAALIPMLFPRIIIFINGIIMKNQKEA